jgi:hypothetical protein
MCSALLQWPVGPEGCKNVVCVCALKIIIISRAKNQFLGHRENEIKQQGTLLMYFMFGFYASFMTALWLNAKFLCV